MFALEQYAYDWELLGFKRYKGTGANKQWADFCMFGSFDGIPPDCSWLVEGDRPQTVCLKEGNKKTQNHLDN